MKINVSAEAKLISALHNIQSRARVRRATAEDIDYWVDDLESRLMGILYKKHWTGLRFNIDPNAQAFPSSYNGRPMSTQVVVERGVNAWFVVDIHRSDCRSRTLVPLNLHEKSEEILHFVNGYKIWDVG